VIGPEVKLRKVGPTDLEFIKNIADSRLREDYTLDLLSYFIESHSECFHVAEIENDIAGFIIAVPLDSQTLRILMLAVKSEHCQKGIGTRLFDRCVQYARTRMMTAMNLEVGVKNETAYEFYQKKGFKVTGILPKYYKDKTDAYVMKKFISM
jgi:ribosomal protein S18 acetylase RimI-like enzyme